MARTMTDPGIAALVERQMRNWELARRQRLSTPETRRDEVEDFVCVSRLVGVDDRIMQLLGERLGWPVFERQILESMAGDDRSRRRVYESMDKRDLSWWEETLGAFLMGREWQRNDYFHRLCQTVLSLARQGSSVFVGRGADLLLPRDRGYRVRLVAQLEQRVALVSAELGIGAERARSEIGRIEDARTKFIRRRFSVEAADPLRFDLTLNVGRLTTEQAVDTILEARSIATVAEQERLRA